MGIGYGGPVKTFTRDSILVLGACLGALTLSSEAQADDHKFEIDVTGGYRFGGTLGVDLDDYPDDDENTEDRDADGRVSVDSSPVFGGILGYRIQQNGFIFLSYSRQATTVRYRPDDPSLEILETDASLEYFQFGGNLQTVRGRFTPYFGFSLGMGRFASLDEGSDNFRFSIAFDGGVKVRIFDFLHLRLLTRLPITFTAGKVYCYTGAGCAFVTNASPFVQGEVQGGLGLSF